MYTSFCTNGIANLLSTNWFIAQIQKNWKWQSNLCPKLNFSMSNKRYFQTKPAVSLYAVSISTNTYVYLCLSKTCSVFSAVCLVCDKKSSFFAIVTQNIKSFYLLKLEAFFSDSLVTKKHFLANSMVDIDEYIASHE